jgi:hypothetical protein
MNLPLDSLGNGLLGAVSAPRAFNGEIPSSGPALVSIPPEDQNRSTGQAIVSAPRPPTPPAPPPPAQVLPSAPEIGPSGSANVHWKSPEGRPDQIEEQLERLERLVESLLDRDRAASKTTSRSRTDSTDSRTRKLLTLTQPRIETEEELTVSEDAFKEDARGLNRRKVEAEARAKDMQLQARRFAVDAELHHKDLEVKRQILDQQRQVLERQLTDRTTG